MATNPNDPLPKVGPDAQRELFARFGAAADGFTADDVMSAAFNLIVNALRQAHTSQGRAAAHWDGLSAKAKELLLSHYFDGDGCRRNIFPFDQHVAAQLFDARKKGWN